MNDVSMIFNAAVDDRKVVSNPFAAKTIRPPKYQAPKVVPWPNDLRARFRAALADRYRISVDLGAGCGLRQGEIFGVSPDDIDPARPVLHVMRQVKLVRGRLIFAPPKAVRSATFHCRTRCHAGWPSTPSGTRRLTSHFHGAPRPASRGT
ncbi:hypothetical protein ACFO0M_15915 [Micromonospora mangrovi]|uniref:Tyr recombinase domain-containing protein n=2 Tax=Micromonospora TaxID=1873 RepID=A0AAU8HLN1_9ACTN